MDERRRSARFSLNRPVKVRCCLTGRYLTAHTENVSSRGMLLEVEHPSLLVAGQRVRVGVSWTPRDVVLASDDMADATVIRSLGIDGKQTVALQFDRSQVLAVSA